MTNRMACVSIHKILVLFIVILGLSAGQDDTGILPTKESATAPAPDTATVKPASSTVKPVEQPQPAVGNMTEETVNKMMTGTSTAAVAETTAGLVSTTASTAPTLQPTSPSTVSSTAKLIISTAKAEVPRSTKYNPPYVILTTPAPTQGNSTLPAGGGVSGATIGIVVGVLLGIILIAVGVLVFILHRRRRKRNLKKDITQIENPRYQPPAERSRGEYKFERDTSVYATPKSKNNNSDNDIEILATRSSSRKKRRAPPPPNPFTGEVDFKAGRRDSRDPDSPPPVELSTFTRPDIPHIDDDDAEGDDSTAKTPLIDRNNGNGPSTNNSDQEEPAGDGNDSGVEDDKAPLDKSPKKRPNPEPRRSLFKGPNGSNVKTPEGYDEKYNPFFD